MYKRKRRDTERARYLSENKELFKNNLRKCSYCKEIKSLISFGHKYRNYKNQQNLRSVCKKCEPWWSIKNRYNLSKLEYVVICFCFQNKKCPICLRNLWKDKKQVLHVDHNHNNGNVRGILHKTCNDRILSIIENQKKYNYIYKITPMCHIKKYLREDGCFKKLLNLRNIWNIQ